MKNVLAWKLKFCAEQDKNITLFPYVELGMMEFMRELQWQYCNKHQLSVYNKDGILIYRYGVETQPKQEQAPPVYFAANVPAQDILAMVH